MVWLSPGMAQQPAAAVVPASAAPPVAAQDDQSSCWLRDAAAPTPAIIYTLCQQGELWLSNDGGKTWTMRDTGAKGRLRALDFLDVNRGIAVGDDGSCCALRMPARAGSR